MEKKLPTVKEIKKIVCNHQLNWYDVFNILAFIFAVVAIILLILTLCNIARAQNIYYISGNRYWVVWDSNTEEDLAGYRVWEGSSIPRSYFNIYDIGMDTTRLFENRIVGKTYFHAVTAYDTAGNESAYSAEVRVIIMADSIMVFEAENCTWDIPQSNVEIIDGVACVVMHGKFNWVTRRGWTGCPFSFIWADISPMWIGAQAEVEVRALGFAFGISDLPTLAVASDSTLAAVMDSCDVQVGSWNVYNLKYTIAPKLFLLFLDDFWNYEQPGTQGKDLAVDWIRIRLKERVIIPQKGKEIRVVIQ